MIASFDGITPLPLPEPGRDIRVRFPSPLVTEPLREGIRYLVEYRGTFYYWDARPPEVCALRQLWLHFLPSNTDIGIRCLDYYSHPSDSGLTFHEFGEVEPYRPCYEITPLRPRHL